MSDPVMFLDTTLRVHEPSAGIDFTLDDKLAVAAALVDAGIDVLELGAPAATERENQAVRRVATEIRGARISALARCDAREIEIAADALRAATQARLHVYLVAKGVEHPLEVVTTSVRTARNLVADVEFSLVDATRADPVFLADIVRRAIAAGATTVNLPDVGFILPDDLGACFTRLRRDVPECEGVVLSFHGHDDLGLATANAVAAVRAGARQIEGAMNGLGGGERNTALEEVALTLRVHGERLGVSTRLDTNRLREVSKLVESRTATGARPSRWWAKAG